MTCLFLDIDGVLNNKASRELFGQIADFHSAIYDNRPFTKERINFDPQCVSYVKILHLEFDLNLVICSNWRFGGILPIHFKNLFALYNWYPKKISMIDTHLVEEGGKFNRSQIIEKYINENDIEKFVILDDTKSHYDRFFNKLVLTDSNLGMTNIKLMEARSILLNQC